MTGEKPFRCPKCGHRDEEFHLVCPACGRRFFRDYIDARMFPRDPDLTGVCTSRFWIWVLLLLLIGSILAEVILTALKLL
jgi:DNA-directed RNA polymerase subunit RPC12/RpoP